MEKEYIFHVSIKKAEDVDGQWVGCVHEINVISQGNSAEHAFDMVVEALRISLLDDLAQGRDPLRRGIATGFGNESDIILKVYVDLSAPCRMTFEAQRMRSVGFDFRERLKRHIARHRGH